MPMVENTPDSGKIIRDMGTDFTRMNMAHYIRGIGNRMRNMVMGFSNGKVKHMLEILLKERRKVKVQ